MSVIRDKVEFIESPIGEVTDLGFGSVEFVRKLRGEMFHCQALDDCEIRLPRPHRRTVEEVALPFQRISSTCGGTHLVGDPGVEDDGVLYFVVFFF